MIYGILTLLTALCISAIAIYYSVAGLAAIFAAAVTPIIIMGVALEVGKLVTAVWLHKFWSKATWWLKTYLSTAVIVLMFITSMGIFGFLSKAHIEQTSASEESVAKVIQIDTEIGRLNAIIKRADDKILALETSGTGADANIQNQIDKEQERIDKAFDRIKPAIAQQNKIIEDARATDGNRTKPYEDQLTNIQAEILRLETSAKDYETKIENLDTDTSVTQPLLDNIQKIEEEIIRVTNQINSEEDSQVKAGQAIIGVSSDGFFGGNTRRALATWVEAQRERIKELNVEISELRQGASEDVDKEKERLAGVIKDIRTVQIPALKDRELKMLEKIDDVRKDESPVIQTARDEIQRLRESAEKQVVNSQALIERLRGQLAQTDKADEIDAAIDEQAIKIKTAEDELDTLTEEKYALQAEYRKLEAEVGPIKYIAEFVYGEQADNNLLEEAVRWVIIIIIFVFDPLAVLLLIASQYTFEWNRRSGPGGDDNGSPKLDPTPKPPFTDKEYDEAWEENIDRDHEQALKDNEEFDRKSYETARAQKIADNIPPDEDTTPVRFADEEQQDVPEHEQTLHEMAMEGFEEEKQDNEDLDKWNNWVNAANKAAEEQFGKEDDTNTNKSTATQFGKELQNKIDLTDEDEDLFDGVDTEEKEAMKLWKAEDPKNNKIKETKQQHDQGKIKELPWLKYLKPEADYKVFPELEEEISKKKESLSWIEKDGAEQVKKTIEKEV